MHIPDGYLSPKTCAVFYAAMAPVWYVASRRLEKGLRTRELPLLALSSAFVFVIMMFNIPVPGGSTGHMVGTAAVAVLLGPWAGVMAMTVALALQAVFFADGGITSFGANAFNMALLMSFSGYLVYTVLASGSPGRRRVIFASAAAGYVSVNAAALAVAVELGIQPIVASGADGLPLYAPYPLGVAVPAMMVSHLLIFGPIEAVGTALVVEYVRRTSAADGAVRAGMPGLRPLWAALVLLVILTPIGLIASGTPWGEWGAEELGRLVGFVPSGMEGLEGAWRGAAPEYGAGHGALGYIVSAAAGSAGAVFLIYLAGRLWRR